MTKRVRDIMTPVKFDTVQGVGYVLDGEGDFDESAHPRDERGQFTSVVSGNTYGHKEGLKSKGYNYHAPTQTWRKSVFLTEKELSSVLKTKADPTRTAEEKALRMTKLGDVFYKDVRVSVNKPYPMNHTEAKSGRFERYHEAHRGSEYKEPRARINPGDRDVMAEESVWGSRYR